MYYQYSTPYQYSNELYHHGIKGQKWGVRRYQNPDGSLTAAGQKRHAKLYNQIDKLYDREEKKSIRKAGSSDAKSGSAKDVYKVARRQVESKYNTRIRDIRKKEVDVGHNFLERELSRDATIGMTIGGLFGLHFTGYAIGSDHAKRKYYKNSPDTMKARESAYNEYSSGMAKAKSEYKTNRKREKG